MGVLDLYDPADRGLPTLELVKSLEVFATHAAVAIENARQYEQLEHTTRGARGSAGPAARDDRGKRRAPLHARRTHAPQPDRSAAQGDRRTTTRWRSASWTRRRMELYCGFATDADYEQVNSWRTPLDVGVTGWVLQHNEAQLVNDMINDPRGALGARHRVGSPRRRSSPPLTVGGEGDRRARSRPHGRAHLRRERARVDQAVRQPGGDRHAERAPVREAGTHLGPARGAARAAAPAVGPEHRPAGHPGPARGVPRSHRHAQGDRGLRCHRHLLSRGGEESRELVWHLFRAT